MQSDAPEAAEKTLVPLGTKLGDRYVVKRVLGSGGMAEVYEAEHTGLRKRVALKVLRPEFAASEEFRERFLREGLAASSIRHPHIVDVTDVGEAGEWVYLVMEMLEGDTLGALMHEHGALPIPKAVDLVLPVIAALGAAHRAGVVHRDMKPENVFLAKDAQGRPFPKVLDFGISKSTRDDIPALTATSTVLGTPHYMSPEQARGEREIGGASDQFSVAMMLYELVSGRLPYTSDTTLRLIHEVARGDVPPPSHYSSGLSDLDGPMRKALATEPGDRYPTIESFGVALLPLASERIRTEWTPALEGRAVTPSIPPPREGGHPPTGSRRAAAGAATAPVRPGSGPRRSAARELDEKKTAAVRKTNPDATPATPSAETDVAAAPPAELAPRPTARPPRSGAVPIGAPSADTSAEPRASEPAPVRRSLALPIVLGLVLLGVVGFAVMTLRGPGTRPVVIAPESAEVTLDGVNVADRPLLVPVDDRPHTIEVSAPGFESRTVRLTAGEEPLPSVGLDMHPVVHVTDVVPPSTPPEPAVDLPPVDEALVMPAVEPVAEPPPTPPEEPAAPATSRRPRTPRTPRHETTTTPPPGGDLRTSR